jgi:hypothetical protein
MEAIKKGTYESDYLKRLENDPIPIAAKRPQVSQNTVNAGEENLVSSN